MVRDFEADVFDGSGDASAADVRRVFCEREELGDGDEVVVLLRGEEVFADGVVKAGKGGKGVGKIVVGER